MYLIMRCGVLLKFVLLTVCAFSWLCVCCVWCGSMRQMEAVVLFNMLCNDVLPTL